MRKSFVRDIQSMVVKVGTSVLASGGAFDKRRVRDIAEQIVPFLEKRIRVTLVSSGAIGAGMTILKLKERPKTIEGLQAAAAVGQRYLMQCYEEAFSKKGFSTAQVLLTWDDLAQRKRFLNARRTLAEIQRRGLVPIINENDTVATEEIRFGDNDRLSSLISILLDADVQVILSDTNGLYSDPSRTQRVQIVEEMGRSVFSCVNDKRSRFTVGGMRAKLHAIRMSACSGIPVFLADGRMRGVLGRIFAGEDVGTFFMPSKGRHRDWANNYRKQIRRGNS